VPSTEITLFDDHRLQLDAKNAVNLC